MADCALIFFASLKPHERYPNGAGHRCGLAAAACTLKGVGFCCTLYISLWEAHARGC